MNPLEKEIIEKFTKPVEDRGCFIVDAEADGDRNITVTIEAMDRDIDLDDCVALDKVFHEIWDSETEDYSLTITSAGLDRPFSDPRQFTKAKGSLVEVRFKGGRKLKATLVDSDSEGITLRYASRESVPGKKKKEEVTHEDRFPFTEINSVRPEIVFD